MMKSLFTILLIFGLANFGNAQCSIAGPNTVQVDWEGTEVDYSFGGGIGSICVGTPSVTWSGPILGTFPSVSCTGFTIDFTAQDATSTVSVTMTTEPEPGQTETVTCTKTITTNCNPKEPVFNYGEAKCGQDENISVTIHTDNDIDSYVIDNLTNFTLVSSEKDGKNVKAEFAFIDLCLAGSYDFTYTNKCGKITRNSTINLSNDLDVWFMTGTDDICIQDGSVLSTYRLNVENFTSDCVSVNWTTTPSAGATIVATGEDMISPFVTISYSQPGRYEIKAVVNACGVNLITKRRTKDVLVCDDVPFLPSVPPLELQYVCFDDFGTCYDFSSFCFSDFIVTTDDDKLLVSIDGPEVCLIDIHGKTRTSILNITPTNACGPGNTVSWTIYVNPPKRCRLSSDDAHFRLQTTENFEFAEVVVPFDLEQFPTEGTMQLEIFDYSGRSIIHGEYDVNQRLFNLPSEIRGMLIAHIIVDGVQYTEKFFRK